MNNVESTPNQRRLPIYTRSGVGVKLAARPKLGATHFDRDGMSFDLATSAAARAQFVATRFGAGSDGMVGPASLDSIEGDDFTVAAVVCYIALGVAVYTLAAYTVTAAVTASVWAAIWAYGTPIDAEGAGSLPYVGFEAPL